MELEPFYKNLKIVSAIFFAILLLALAAYYLVIEKVGGPMEITIDNPEALTAGHGASSSLGYQLQENKKIDAASINLMTVKDGKPKFEATLLQ